MLATLRSKPLMCICLVFLACSCVAVYIPTVPKLIMAGAFLFSALLFFLFGSRLLKKLPDRSGLKTVIAVVLLSAFAACCVSFVTFDLYTHQFTERDGKEDTVALEITEVVYTSSFGARYYATVTESTLFQGEFRIALDSTDSSLLLRDRLTGTITYKILNEDIGGYNEQRYALSKGIVIGADAKELSYAGCNSAFSLSYFFRDLNDSLCRRLFLYTGEEDGGLAAAVLLGNKAELPDTLKRDFRRLGMIHILSLSGAHLAILTTMSERILLKIKVTKKKRALFNIAAVLLFMALTGFPSSLTRAGIMLILANIAYLAKRTHDYPTSLTFACAMIVALNPFSALDYGLHLSFVAAHSCYISATVSHGFTSLFTWKRKSRFPRARKVYNRIIRYITGTVVFNLVISVHILPLIFLYFGEMSLVSLPANLLYMPLITLLMYVAILFYLLSPFAVFSAPLASVISALTAFISSTSERFSSLRGIVLPLNYWFTPIFIIPIVILTAIAFCGRKRIIQRVSRISIYVFALFLCTVGIFSLYDGTHVTAEYITKGKNDGFLVKSGGQLLAVEVSDGSYSFASKLVSHRSDLNCAEVEAYMLTHYHKKLVSALTKLTDFCILRTLILPYPITEADTEIYHQLSLLAAEKGFEIILTDRDKGDTVYFNGTEIEVYPLTLLSRSDHPIIAFRIAYSENEIMYLGGSFNEGCDNITVHAAEAEALVFGGHSPVYKKAFDSDIAESKTVYLSDYAAESLKKLSPDITEALESTENLTAKAPIRLDRTSIPQE